ncbi:MAG: bacillithiol biosynthesis cysteine-adding enzyme BshC [Clostridia bacterium]|nr:bacillithiol biosynthesis cysteine-adding enzyme BshC [Clostridia bacterium]
MLIDCNYLNSTKIVADYLTGKGEIGRFFAHSGYNVADITSYNLHSSLDKAGQKTAEMRDKLTDSLIIYNEKLGCSQKTLDNIQKLRDPQTKAVVTGQQAALLTGAAFVIYKAITAILLALQLEEEIKSPVVPVFWIASEDHDFLEINNCSFLGEKGQLEKYSITNSIPGLPPVGTIPLGENTFEILERLIHKFDNQAVIDLVVQIKELARKAGNLADFYGQVMTLLFGRYGLIFIDPMLPDVRELVKPLGETVFDCFDEITGEIERSAIALIDGGYHPVFLGDNSGQFPMFVEINGQREPIYINGSDVIIGKQSPVFLSYESLRQSYWKDSTKFSPNAYLRPVVQDFLLPTIAFVAGPGEINYLAQLKGIYKILGVKMPIIFPRARITLISTADYELLGKIGTDFPIDKDRLNAHKEMLLLDKDEGGVFADLKRYRNTVNQEHQSLAATINSYEPSLRELTAKNLGKINYQINYLEEKVRQSFKKRFKQDLHGLDRFYNLVHPRDKEQEMTVNILSLLDLFGVNLIEKLMRPEYIYNTDMHKLVVIRGDS